MKEITELLFVLDKSGSMHNLVSDTIGGYNSLLLQNQQDDKKTHVTTILFDNNIQLLHDRLDIQLIQPITTQDYQIGGSTALLDAIGYGINKIKQVQKHQEAQVMMVIITDGYENASREYSGQTIKKMIQEQKEKGWEIIFLGANIDIEKIIAEYGLERDRTMSYHADKVGVTLNYEVVSDLVKTYRNESRVDKKRIKDIEKDYNSRKK